MKTDELIAALVADRSGRPRPIRSAVWPALGVGLLASLVLFVAEYGPRLDLAAALTTWRFDLKLAIVLLALVVAFALCLALARPVAPAHPWRRLAPLALLVAAAVGVELVLVPSADWSRRLVGSNWAICLATIPILALAPLVALLLALRRAAPASPTRAGAAAGLLAAAAGATLYAFHCFDDSPLFVATWYGLAALPVIAAGALAGRRLLRW